ncbi:hypothetical protein [Arthrobacter sp. Soil736]|uniref:hypothetical protein n=1 Tax=Arthrobacter sp. Soil736 TaxID=1736395 RepID=UPI000B01DA2D|nr:hypothetical protein [Arthrobacter sp. Soil736]
MNAGALNDDSRKDDAAPSKTPGPVKKASASVKKASAPVKPAGVVPNKASEDDPRAWGDSGSDNDHDAWLKEQRPPHWG